MFDHVFNFCRGRVVAQHGAALGIGIVDGSEGTNR